MPHIASDEYDGPSVPHAGAVFVWKSSGYCSFPVSKLVCIEQMSRGLAWKTISHHRPSRHLSVTESVVLPDVRGLRHDQEEND
jgi:hypothetical protein